MVRWPRRTSKRGRYVSYGVGGRFTGRDADGLICDDLIDERDADNPTLMAKAHRAVRALRNRFNPAGAGFGSSSRPVTTTTTWRRCYSETSQAMAPGGD